MLRFHDIAITLRPAAADLPVVPAAEALHRKTVFQDIFAECFYDLLQLRLEGRVVSFLHVARPPNAPEFFAAAPKVHLKMSNGSQTFILTGRLGIK